MGYLFSIGIICFFGVTLKFVTAITYDCNNGVECIALDKCIGLYRQWQEAEDKTDTMHLIRMLLCGYTDTMPEVCCPADIYLSNNIVDQPVSKPVSDPVREPVHEPTNKPFSEPASGRVSEPVGKPVHEPASKPASVPVSKPFSEPVHDPASKPVSEPVSKPVSEPVHEPASKPISEPVSKPVSKIDRTHNITCGLQNDDKIFGGEQTKLDEHTWMALLRYDNGNRTEYFCGGVLISSRYILTAAHCVKGSSLDPAWKLTQVRLGEWKMSKDRDCDSDGFCNNVTDVPIEEAIAHELFDPKDKNMHNDIAILRLSKDVKFTDYVSPICLPTDTDLLNSTFEGHNLQVAGWGKTENSSSSDVKLKVIVQVENNTKCRDQYHHVKKNITDKQLCAGGRAGKDSCKGDSGGALMGAVGSAFKKWTAIGVVSYGPTPCGTEGWPAIYTRVTSYIDWIRANMRP